MPSTETIKTADFDPSPPLCKHEYQQQRNVELSISDYGQQHHIYLQPQKVKAFSVFIYQDRPT